MELTYIIGPKAIFDQRFSDFSIGVGHYYNVGFKTFGAIRNSLDGMQTFFKGEMGKFDPNDLAMDGVVSFTEEEAKIYMAEHILEWETEVDFT